jgi:diguanylate cyclase (GGDEF)-like protein
MDELTQTADVGELILLERTFDQRSRASQGKHHYSIVLVDITALRNINLRFGSATGDGVLIYVADQLKTLCPDDCVARVGGDKFAVLVDGYEHHDATQLKRRIRAAVNLDPVDILGQPVAIHVDVTCRTGPQDEFEETQLLWRVQRDSQVELIRSFEQRLDALEKYAMQTILADRADLQTRLSKIELLAQHDQLTGLLNRRGYDALLSSLKPPYALAFVDVDNLREINKSQGGNWAAGDRALRSVGRLLERVSPAGVVVRWGGDEFLVLLPAMTSTEARESLQSLLRHSAVELRAGELPVTFSGGVSEVTSSADHAAAMKAAQQAAQNAKSAGKSQILIID